MAVPPRLRWRSFCVAVAVALTACPGFVLAQQQPAAPVAPGPPPAAAPAPQQFQQSQEWSKLPRMQLERQFAGPLQDTVIQRLRDPVDGTVCYLYLPISVAHSATTVTGFVQYGPNTIGSIDCLASAPVPARRK
jgi:hypothetical protein